MEEWDNYFRDMLDGVGGRIKRGIGREMKGDHKEGLR